MQVTRRGVSLSVGGALLLALGCESNAAGPGGAVEPSQAFGIWQPSNEDTCTAEIHDQFAVVGSDARLYPTWHPPVDPASDCTFGHEHGRDPRGSNLYDQVGDVPFGVANEALDTWDPQGRRHEDHVGHKVEWENDIEMRFSGGVASSLFEVRCDVLTKLHQGTHSKDAYTNNLHEVVYHVRCTDGTAFGVTMMATIGTPGELVSTCDRDLHIEVGPPTPLNSPSGGGKRIIPTRDCIEQHILVGTGESSSLSSGLRESWQISQSVRTEDGRRLAFFNPYYQVVRPSRFYDPGLPDGVGRVIDLCYEVTEDGRRADLEDCEASTGGGVILDLPYDDSRSRFNGAQRFVDVNSNRVTNAEGPEIWYSDPFGGNARTEPFPGAVRQFVARFDNDHDISISGPNIGRDRDYGGRGVRAPN